MIEGKLKFDFWDSWQPIFFDMDNGIVYFRNESWSPSGGSDSTATGHILEEWIANRVRDGELIICDKLTPLKRIPHHDTMTGK